VHAVCDGGGRPNILLLTEGQMSDHVGAGLVPDALPPASSLIADRGYESVWFRTGARNRGHRALHSLKPQLQDPL
jgi:putative transposase